MKECSRLRILAPLPTKKNLSKDEKIIMDLSQWILNKELKLRPFVTDIISRVEEILANYDNPSIDNNIV